MIKRSFCHKFTGPASQKTSLTKVVKEYVPLQDMSWRPLNMKSSCHKMLIYVTKAVKEYALMLEMLSITLNMELFSHKLFISSQPYWSHKTQKLIYENGV